MNESTIAEININGIAFARAILEICQRRISRGESIIIWKIRQSTIHGFIEVGFADAQGNYEGVLSSFNFTPDERSEVQREE